MKAVRDEGEGQRGAGEFFPGVLQELPKLVSKLLDVPSVGRESM